MANYISQLDMSLDEAKEQNLQHHGFKRINVNLNKGSCGYPIYIWYKHGSVPITRLQVTFNDEMAAGLISAGYTKIPEYVEAGVRGDFSFLWYFRGSGEYDTPIVDIDVTTDAKSEVWKFGNDWERLACDLNHGVKENTINAWVKREKKTYVCDVTATYSFGLDKDYFQSGYIRVDHDTTQGAGGSPVFVWYRQTTDSQRGLSALQVSTDDTEFQDLCQENYQQVKVNLNEGTAGNQVYLWYKKVVFGSPIKAVTLLYNPAAIQEYDKPGVNVIKRNLNTGSADRVGYLCVRQ